MPVFSTKRLIQGLYILKRFVIVAFACLALLVPTFAQDATGDLSAIKTYLLENVNSLQAATTRLKEAATSYYTLAESVGFDYAKLWTDHRLETTTALLSAKDAWLVASALRDLQLPRMRR